MTRPPSQGKHSLSRIVEACLKNEDELPDCRVRHSGGADHVDTTVASFVPDI